ncbi:hypothetical protein QJQ45_023973, partial [Haematococcus lacustris]
MRQQPSLECVCFTLIVDDIVLPSGVTYMAQLGGGGPQTLFGWEVVSQCLRKHAPTPGALTTGLAAGVGPDLPPTCVSWLQQVGVDTSGLLQHQRPTPRAWQVFEEDGRRTQVWRGPGGEGEELWDMLRPRLDTLPDHFLRAANFHIGVHPQHPPLRLLRELRQLAHAAGGVLSVETYTG